ncbi:hypothetical protein ICN84_03375 [Akkermansia glycaniphila]|uniref:3-deoxy-D-manno-octulosonic acid transferase n=1 Tax=Akkermansia glycaniphila TaxID=1679444 RepID=UPI001C01143A|nr:glycosyltransferase N-terminal domain-containing protein [Akkermansia glycaniphila]MBT9449112.1 hypothetical protein [Akkermansia glycaniphila]
MSRLLLRLVYNCFFPLFLVLALPGYLVKMKRRGGWGTGLAERFGIYRRSRHEEPQGGLYVHAVSVGEVMIALKLIREWLKEEQGPVVLATSTATGHEIARQAALPGVRVLYSPLDLPGLSGRCLRRFRPKCIALIEAELWPNFAAAAARMKIPMVMLNARLSPRSERRYAKIRPVTRTLFSWLSGMGVQNRRDAGRFEGIGVDPSIIEVTGSIKFDVLTGEKPHLRPDFRAVLERLSSGRMVVLAASTHAGEEVLIARAVREAGAFPLIVPRHAERRHAVVKDMEEDGWQCVLRSSGEMPEVLRQDVCYIADTTGELRDWTALADVAVIGKSFLSTGGQNPAEAIVCRVPVVCGMEMSNFEDLVALLNAEGGIWQCTGDALAATLKEVLSSPEEALARTGQAYDALSVHSGATSRSVELVRRFFERTDG